MNRIEYSLKIKKKQRQPGATMSGARRGWGLFIYRAGGGAQSVALALGRRWCVEFRQCCTANVGERGRVWEGMGGVSSAREVCAVNDSCK